MLTALRHYREDKIAWPQVVAEAVQVAVMAQRVAVDGVASIREIAPEDASPDQTAAHFLPWIISFWAISRSSDGEEDGHYAVQRLEIGGDGVRPTPEIQVAASLEEARRLIPAGLRRFGRHPLLDDPSVMEVWI